MSPDAIMAIFACVVCVSYAVQTVTGFGSMVVCVTVGAHLLEIRELVTLAVPISLLQTSYIAMRHRDGIRWELLLRRVLPAMCAGMAVAFAFFADAGGDWLRRAFALMVLVLGGLELWRMRRGAADTEARLSKGASMASMVGAGVIHGIYATGGPLLVYALSRERLSKGEFRSTLTMVWLLLSIVLLANFTYEGRYTGETLSRLLWLVPALPVGVAFGEWLHNRVSERVFKVSVYGLLVAAAVTLLVR